MIKFIGVVLLLLAGNAFAETTVFNVSGTQSDRMAGCVPPFPLIYGWDCSYDASNPTGAASTWTGPQTAGNTYLPGQTSGTRYAVPFTGTVTLENNGNACDRDATLAMNLAFSAATLQVRSGSSSTVRETWANGDLVYKVAATPLTLAIPNAAGGCDYEIASIGMPRRLAGSSALYPLSPGAYSKPSKIGIASFENNVTQGAIATVELGPSYTCVGTTASLCNTDSTDLFGANYGKERAVFENVLIGISTDGTGNIINSTIFINSEYLIPLFDPQPLNSWGGFVLTFTGDCVAGCDLIRAPAITPASVFCPGDINVDGIADVAMLTADSQLRIEDLNGTILVLEYLRNRTGAQTHRTLDLVLLADTNANDTGELAVLNIGGGTAEITRKELVRNDGFLPPLSLAAQQVPIDLELLTDPGNSASPKLASLDWDTASVQVTDITNQAVTADIAFSSYLEPVDLTVYSDLDGDTSPELAMLGTNSGAAFGAYDPAAYGDKLEIRSIATGATVRNRFFAKPWQVLQQALLGDANGNSFPEAAVLLSNHADGRINVVIIDTTVDMSTLRNLGFESSYPPIKMLTIADIDANGADEIVVFGRRTDGLNQKARIRDSATGAQLNTLFFEKSFVGQDMAACPDLNANGAEELVMLGRRASDGKYRAIIKDSKTGALLASLDL